MTEISYDPRGAQGYVSEDVPVGEPQSPKNIVAWCGWHPDHGFALQTCGHDEQHASSLLMRTNIAGDHGWSVQPLYADTRPDRKCK